jgi:hypothetical protein
MSLPGSQPQPGVPLYKSRESSTLPLFAPLLPQAALPGGHPQKPYFLKGDWSRAAKSGKSLLQNCLSLLQGDPVRSLQAEVGVAPLPLHLDGMQARFRLKSAKSSADKVVREGSSKVRRLISPTRTCLRRTKTPRDQQNLDIFRPPIPPILDPAPLAETQLF